MAQSFRFICNSCAETIESWDEGHPYYFDSADVNGTSTTQIRNATSASEWIPRTCA